ncbi:MAG: methyltransferase [Lachnospiraceae bacterium]|nr:methyltransferase [Lachnospiraceae bacterium]
MSNFEFYFDIDGQVKPDQLAKNRWLAYLTQTDNVYVNAERLERMRDVSGRETVEYVMRTLDVLDFALPQGKSGSSEEENDFVMAARQILREVLCWSEVAKGGLRKEREEWRRKGYPLDIHNIASAEIYSDLPESSEAVYLLIRTHGLIGQCIRGEIQVRHNEPLLYVRELMGLSNTDMRRLVLILNECIIRGVSDSLWDKVKQDVTALVDRILEGDLSEYSAEYRLEKLCPKEIQIYKEEADFFAEKIFPKYELWYFESALGSFDLKQIRMILTRTLQELEGSGDVHHLNFKPLADSLYYDYEGRRHINVYKKRIIEKFLRDGDAPYVKFKVWTENGTAYVDFAFAAVCEKLIEFCVEAERSGLLTFEKSIIVLYDMFGFRKDEFDRLNNEDKYLQTMNDVSASTKDGIIDYVVGQSVVDVGSGGGILLDRLEAKYPGMQVIGTDISANVIEALEQKKKKEGHKWSVTIHNFVEKPFEKKVDSIVFSSILHEIFSYTEGEHGRFDLDSVKKALRFAYESLTPGGRIIIRDGVKTEGAAIRKIRFKTTAGMDFFRNYQADFKGLTDIPEDRKVIAVDEAELTVSGDVNLIREFLYTYTWGTESYAHEVQEQFGYFTLAEYRAFLNSLGAKVLCAEEILEPGYPENLNRYLTLTDEQDKEVEYPASNCILVAEKVS